MYFAGLAGTAPNCRDPDALCELCPPELLIVEDLYLALKRM
jgi:hypothetical protein